MNRLSLARRTQIIGALVEGNSIRSTERMTNTHRDTIMRLMVEVGTGCAKWNTGSLPIRVVMLCKKLACIRRASIKASAARQLI